MGIKEDRQIVGLILIGIIIGFLACILIVSLCSIDGYKIEKDDKIVIKSSRYRVIDIKYDENDQRNITLEVNRL